ncbi:MAG TPA: cytochrome b, partial [Pseudonocardiaceae bacterium]|nr:cytochrome b [Pseudonocardiaceae bacterium]
AIPLEYQGTPVPKRMNQLGIGGAPVPGSLLTPDPAEQTVALEKARQEEVDAEVASRDGHRAGDGQRASRVVQQEAIAAESGRPKDTGR